MKINDSRFLYHTVYRINGCEVHITQDYNELYSCIVHYGMNYENNTCCESRSCYDMMSRSEAARWLRKWRP